MNKKRYTINPCRAASFKAKVTDDPSIQTINETCYAVCSAFGNSNDSWSINNSCAEACKECVNNCKCADSCDQPPPFRPPIFVQSAHHFPGCLVETGDKKAALSCCLQKCCQGGGMNKNECQQNCMVDASAVEEAGGGGGGGLEEGYCRGTSSSFVPHGGRGGSAFLFFLGWFVVAVIFIILISSLIGAVRR